MMFLALLLTLALGALQTTTELSSLPLEEVVSWEQWREHFGKKYDRLEELHRKKQFLENVNTILKHNAEGHNWRMGVNQFSDLSGDEWVSTYTNNTFKHTAAPGGPELLKESPLTSVDWRTTGAVTAVKNQEQCGSCWAFSTTGSLEGAWFNAHKELIPLSEEQLVQCDRGQDQGCQGGLMDYAFSYIHTAGGITGETEYPYTSGSGVRGSCHNPLPAFHATVASYKDVSPNNALQFQAALAIGPVSVAVEADKSAWQHYSSGVMDSEACGTSLDHGVLAVGFDTEGAYWIVKNSWGATWGEAGYIRLGMTSTSRHGICGVLSQPSYPIAGDSPGPGPSPGPTPSPGPAGNAYEDPADGCSKDEVAIQVQGIDGDFCSPLCAGSVCPDAPADAADGVAASCVLQTSGGDKYCALTCKPSFLSVVQCGPTNMTCKRASVGVGLCTYDD